MTPSSEATRNRHDTLSGVTSRSGKGTARQTIRIDEELWDKLDAAAQALGTDRSAYIREFARWAVREKGAKMPRRPAGAEDIHQPPTD